VCFGEPNTGKSSFIATSRLLFDESLNGKVLSQMTVVGIKAGESFTKNIGFYPLKDSNITLVDAWGWEKSQDENGVAHDVLDLKFFQALLEGRVRHNHVQGQEIPTGVLGQPNPKDKITAVVFFVLANSGTQQVARLWKDWDLQEYYKMAKAYEVNVVFAMSKLDEIIPDCIDSKPTEIVGRAEYTNLERQLSNGLSDIDDPFIVPLVSLKKAQLEQGKNEPTLQKSGAYVLDLIYKARQRPTVVPIPYQVGCWGRDQQCFGEHPLEVQPIPIPVTVTATKPLDEAKKTKPKFEKS